MNRRLFKDTYLLDEQLLDFTYDLPAWLAEPVSGSGVVSRVDNTDARGAGIVLTTGAQPADISLDGPTFDPAVVKGLSIEWRNARFTGTAPYVDLGPSSADGSDFAVISMSNSAGNHNLLVQKDTSGTRSTVPILALATIGGPIDIGLDIDFVNKVTEAHIGWATVRDAVAANFPADDLVLRLAKMRANATRGADSTFYCSQIKVETYR